MEPADLLDLDITDVAHGGVFVARHEGRVVFVADAIPGERVRVRVTEVSKKAFWRGEVLEVLDASPDRRPHVWSAADVANPPQSRPGGADFGHIDLSRQRELKLRVLDDALRRIGGLSLPISIEQAHDVFSDDASTVVDSESPDGTGWRTRIGLHVDDEGRIGPYAARSHRVIPVRDLPLATAAIQHAAQRLTHGAPGGLDLVQPADGRVRVIPRPQSRRRSRSSAHNRRQPAHEVVIERVNGRDFRVDAGGFWQVHRLAAHSLTQLVAGSLRELRADGPAIDPDAWHLDLYGGVGLFAATLADLANGPTRITSVESDPRATERAGENLAEWHNAAAETARVDRWLPRLREQASGKERDMLSRGVVILDPPRSGAGRAVAEDVAALSPTAIVYVACDPVALARDLAVFAEHGYHAARVHAVDLFPHSHHIEAVAVLSGDS